MCVLLHIGILIPIQSTYITVFAGGAKMSAQVYFSIGHKCHGSFFKLSAPLLTLTCVGSRHCFAIVFSPSILTNLQVSLKTSKSIDLVIVTPSYSLVKLFVVQNFDR
uniref:Uncharacterized protein n=1 Tax=Anguilla anguilla TaxID=7936 RepID=A0A0E9XEL5_ANGAN